MHSYNECQWLVQCPAMIDLLNTAILYIVHHYKILRDRSSIHENLRQILYFIRKIEPSVPVLWMTVKTSSFRYSYKLSILY